MKTKEKPKRKTKRSSTPYPNLKPELNLKIRQHLIECDYIHKLNDEEKAFLDKFNNETINASFNTKNPRKNLHKTKEQRKRCYDANNARNRDAYSRAQAGGKCLYLDDVITSEEELHNRLEQALSLGKGGKNSGDGD